MAAVLDFLRAALPWVGIGLFLVISIMKNGIEKTPAGEERDAAMDFHKKIAPVPSILMFILAVLEYLDKNTTGGTTWLVLAVVFFVLSTLNKPSDKQVDPKNQKSGSMSNKPGVNSKKKR
ncbi:MAG: hypothetical protein MJ097_04945 [Dorea sp.]|nr:hypothetical protein [Dorea sp.]